jgi:hypothetical protein
VKLLPSAAVVIAVALLAGCSASPGGEASASPTADAEEQCAVAVDDLVSAVGTLVSDYAQPDGTRAGGAQPPATPQATDGGDGGSVPGDKALADAAAKARDARERLGCDAKAFQSRLEDGLGSIQPSGAIADAVWRRVSASLLGTVRQATGDYEVAEGEDLRDVLARSPEGTTVVLPTGATDVGQTLVLLAGVTLKGAGRDVTTLASTATDATIIVATGSLVQLQDLTVQMTADHPSSGLVAGPSASVSLAGVRITGATAATGAVGGAGVYLSAQGDEASGRGTTLEITDSLFERNGWAGVAVAGGHRVSIQSASFTGNGGAGVLFLDASTGSIDGSTFTDNAVGVAVSGTAAPVVLGSTFTGGSVGVQADESGSPVLDGLRITGVSSAAVIFGGNSGGSIGGTSCEGAPHGIVVSDTAAPTIGENSCPVVRGGS